MGGETGLLPNVQSLFLNPIKQRSPSLLHAAETKEDFSLREWTSARRASPFQLEHLRVVSQSAETSRPPRCNPVTHRNNPGWTMRTFICVVYVFLENLDFVHWRTTVEGHFCSMVSDSAPWKVIASDPRNSKSRIIGRHNNLERWWGDTMLTRFDIVFAKLRSVGFCRDSRAIASGFK